MVTHKTVNSLTKIYYKKFFTKIVVSYYVQAIYKKVEF